MLTYCSWYHGAITRAEAEQRLQSCVEGSYLVRVCESNQNEFALSLKSVHFAFLLQFHFRSASGFMHMKIQQYDADKMKANGQTVQLNFSKTDNHKNKQLWILGYFSQPFADIPQMIKYYSTNTLPIKNAEHMCLLYPIVEQLL
jgi:hypothetical protein